jgi:hypothetical protein
VIVTVAFTCQLGCMHSRHYPPSALIMDGELDVASTSDADERELLEAANFDLYWDHVMARSQVDPHHHPPNALPDTGAAGGRYSMRTRQPRQLKPYVFDRLAYKQQLKHHPDAIVKLVGRRSPVESSSRLSEGDTDDAAENSGGEHPSENARTLPRIKGKKRYRAGGGHPSTPPPVAHRRTSGVQLSSGSPLDRRFTGPRAITDLALVESIPDIDGGDSSVEAGAWYPDAFNDLSSGLGGDDMPPSTAPDDLRESHTPPPRVKRRRVLFLLFDGCL